MFQLLILGFLAVVVFISVRIVQLGATVDGIAERQQEQQAAEWAEAQRKLQSQATDDELYLGAMSSAQRLAEYQAKADIDVDKARRIGEDASLEEILKRDGTTIAPKGYRDIWPTDGDYPAKTCSSTSTPDGDFTEAPLTDDTPSA